jgi:hypothetical protein
MRATILATIIISATATVMNSSDFFALFKEEHSIYYPNAREEAYRFSGTNSHTYSKFISP